MAAERKVRNHKATPPTLPSDISCVRTLIIWVEFDMYVCLQQRERKKLHWELLLLIICVCTNAPTLCVFLSQITALWKGEKTKCSTVNIKLNNGTVEPMFASSRELCAFLCSCCLMYQQSSGQHLLIISVNAFLRLLYVCFNVNVNEGYIEKRWKVELPWWEETDSLNLKIPSFKWLRLYIMLE